MFKNSFGKETHVEELIFPLVSYNPDSRIWKCVGTGFFIHGYGGFVTAKQAFYDNNGNHLPTLYAVQTTSNMEILIRRLRHFVPHLEADIAIGFLGMRTLSGTDVPPEITTSFMLNFEKLETGDPVRTYAFPLTEKEEIGDSQVDFTFAGKWSKGEIVDFHEGGSPWMRTRCYQTTIQIEHGASGGTLFYGSSEVGINSSGIHNLPHGDVRISYITPINLIPDLYVSNSDKMITVEIIKVRELSILSCKFKVG